MRDCFNDSSRLVEDSRPFLWKSRTKATSASFATPRYNTCSNSRNSRRTWTPFAKVHSESSEAGSAR
eukprot:9706723-Alexandrium_andersonii.AAC.1